MTPEELDHHCSAVFAAAADNLTQAHGKMVDTFLGSSFPGAAEIEHAMDTAPVQLLSTKLARGDITTEVRA